MLCPHCEHPQIVPKTRRGVTRFCRQCARAYATCKTTPQVQPVAVKSYGELNKLRSDQPRVYVIS